MDRNKNEDWIIRCERLEKRMHRESNSFCFDLFRDPSHSVVAESVKSDQLKRGTVSECGVPKDPGSNTKEGKRRSLARYVRLERSTPPTTSLGLTFLSQCGRTRR